MNGKIGAGGLVALVVVALLIAAGVQALVGNTTEDDAAWPCEYFQTALRDFQDGTTTAAEFRAGLQEVERRSVIASERIQTAARNLLSQATSGTVSGIRGALGEMQSACVSAGVN